MGAGKAPEEQAERSTGERSKQVSRKSCARVGHKIKPPKQGLKKTEDY